MNSWFEITPRELHAKLLGPSNTSTQPTRRATHQQPSATGLEGAGGTCRGAGGRRRGLAGLRHERTPSAADVEGAGGSGGHGRASRSTTPSRRLACGDLAGGRARRRPEHQRHRTQQQPGYAKGAGTEVPAPCRLTQPLPRRGSGRMILSPGDGDASTGTCRPRRPLPGPLRRSGRRSRCARGPSSAWWPGRRARRNRSSRR